MEDRLLFDGIYIQGDGPAKDEAIEFSFSILPHPAEASFRRRDAASMVAEVALYLPSL
jgi:hypothetical protein